MRVWAGEERAQCRRVSIPGEREKRRHVLGELGREEAVVVVAVVVVVATVFDGPAVDVATVVLVPPEVVVPLDFAGLLPSPHPASRHAPTTLKAKVRHIVCIPFELLIR